MKTPALHHLLLGALLAFPAWLSAQTPTSAVPGQISYQGRVLNAAGGLVGAGTPVNRTVIFRVWDHSSNTLIANLLYSEAQTVTISEGEFSVLVGTGSANSTQTFGYSETTKGPPTVNLANVFNGQARFLGVTVAAGTSIATTDNEITPRQQIVSSAFAFRSRFAESLGSNGATAITTLDTGNVGVGNTAPPALFTITGANTSLTTNTPQFIITDSVDNNERLLFGVDSTNNGTGFIQATKVGSGGQSLLLNPNGGAVGIGSNFSTAPAPTTKLVLQGDDSSAPPLQLNIRGSTDNNKRLVMGYNTTNNYGALQAYSGASTAANLVLNEAGGNVGIGTASPGARLSLGATLANSKLLLYDDGTSFHGLGVQANQFRLHTATSADRFSFLNAPNGTENLTILGGGNVGIGTTTPGQKLDVIGGTQSQYLELRANAGTPYIDFSSTSGADYHARIIWQGTGTNRLDFDAPGYSFGNGAVGIGTTPNASRAKLTVGNVNTTAGINTPFPQGRYMDNTSTGVASQTWGGGSVSIEAQSNIVCNGVFATSDERIKKVLGQSDGAADLRTLLGIKVTDYVFKDQIANGGQPQKKVIAQQVEKIFPQAVSRGTNTVPDIFKKAAIKDGWVSLTTDLKKGDRVKLIDDRDAEAIHEVLEVKKDKFRTDFKTDAKNVFVYGREVSDFRRVDYEAISMLNVSATQQFKKETDAQVKALKDENADLKDKLAAQDKRLAEIEAKDKARDAKLAAIEKALESAGKAAVRTASLKKAE